VLGGVRSYLRGIGMWQRGLVSAVVNACVWTILYLLFLRTPLPVGWSIRTAEVVCAGVGIVLGGLGCMTSRRLWPIAVGAAAGIVMGGAEAVVSDTSMSYWQRVCSGLVLAPFPLYLWLAIVGSWISVSVALHRWHVPQAVTAGLARVGGRRTRR
jgi:hypothetical protein